MIAVIHQPHFLPWLGYFNKLANADIYIAQDNVQFRKRYYQNRTLIRNIQNNPIWLTIPVNSHLDTLIRDIHICNDRFLKNIAMTIYHSYCRSKYFKYFYNDLISTILDLTSLVEINIESIKFILKILDIKVDIYYASKLKLLGSPTEQLVSACHRVNANEYIFGEGGGIAYHGISMFKSHGIKIHKQDFVNNFIKIANDYYPLVNNLSVIDFLFNIGPEKTKDIITNSWSL